MFAATYPERVSALILQNTWPRVTEAPDFPAGDPVEKWHRRVREVRVRWGERDYQVGQLRKYYPSYVGDPVFEQWYVNHERLAASPGAAAWFMRVLMETDIREVLPAISVPPLLLHRAEWWAGGAYIAERIPNAEMVELTGTDKSMYAEPQIADEIERFLSEGRADSAPERVLTTVLFTDIVDSTSRAAELGDRRWTTLLEAHHAAVRAQLARYGGKEVRGTGDGFFATFDGPARAIACAQGAVNAVAELGLEIRAGVHTGEVELIANRSKASRCTLARGSRPRHGHVRCSSEHRPGLGGGPGSTSRSAACERSRACREIGACLRLTRRSARLGLAA